VNSDHEKASICFDCKNAYAHKCAWIGLGRSVKGFVYDIVDYPGLKHTKTISVTECPNFVRDGKKPKDRTKRNNLILELAQKDEMTIRKIAAIADVSEFTVQRVITELGLSERKRKCSFCGTPFRASGNSKYCSALCREKGAYIAKYKNHKCVGGFGA